MADGSITFSTALDNEQLEKDIKRTGREIDALKRKIEEGKSEESFAKSQMEAAKQATEEARRAVERLREELGVADEGKLASDLKDASREAATLEASMGKMESGKSAIEEQMAQGEAAIRKTEQKLRDLKSLLEELEGVDPEDAWEWHGAQLEIDGARQAVEETSAALEKQIEDQDALNAKWQGLDERAGEYTAKLEEASARQAELASKSSRLSEANASLRAQTQEQDRLTKKWRGTNEQAEKYTRQLERATQRQRELGEEYARTYSRAGTAVSAGMEKARSGMDAFASRINTMLKRVFVFGVILKAVRAIADALTGALAENDRFSASWENLRATVVGVANAIANLVAPALTGMVNAATAAIQTLAQTVDNIFGTNIMQAIQAARSAAEANWRQTDASKAAQKALEKQAKAAKKLAKEEEKAKKTLLSFDEINAMQAETAEDAADGLDDEAEGLADPASLMKPDWGSFDVGKIDATLAEIMLILGAALMAVGAILCFSGINIPLGITLMVIGALMIYTAYKEQWDKLPQEVRDAITGALVITGIVLVVLGAVLAFSGVNVPLGIGMMVAGALLLWTAVGLNWESMPDEVRNVVTILMGILSVALIVIGAILTFSGANVPLGIALMVAGAVSLAAMAAINWDRMPEEIRNVVSVVMGILGGALLVVGAILALSGVSLPLGIGLMAVGAVLLAADAALNWNTIQEHLDTVIPVIEAAVGIAFLTIGAILCFSGANVPLGIALLAVGAISLGKAIMENWETMPEQVKGAIAVIEFALGVAFLVIGAILCFSGANIPLGIGLLAVGALAMGHAVTENWDAIPDEVKGTIATIELAVGAAFLVIGAVLTFSGANIPLGIGLLAIGALAMGHALTENWDAIPQDVQNTVAVIESIVAPALLVIGAVLTFSGANIPLGIALLAGGALVLAHLATLDWDAMPGGVRSTVSTILGIVGGALVVLGIILCVTGVGIPLGVACIIAGAASLVTAVTLNWDFIVDKVKEIWGKVVNFWDTTIAPIFTSEWWANLFKPIVDGLEGLANGIRGTLDDLFGWIRGGVTGVFDFLAQAFPQAAWLFEGLRDTVLAILSVIQGAVNGTISGILAAVGGLVSGVGQILGGIVGVVAGVLTGSVDGILNGLRGMVNGFITIIEGMLNGVITGVVSFANGIINGLSHLPGVSIPSITFPGVSLPRLAQGAVIPPNREFMAVLGDQKSGTNIETPEALMRQVVREEAGAMMAQVMMQMQGMGGFDHGGDVSLTLEVEGEALAVATERGRASAVRRGLLTPTVEFV